MAKKIVTPGPNTTLTFTRKDGDGHIRNWWVVPRPEYSYDAATLGNEYAAQVIRLALESEFHGYNALEHIMADPKWQPGGSVEGGFMNMIMSCAMAGIREVETNNAAPFDYEAAVEAAGLNR
jgi:hypothetical protein